MKELCNILDEVMTGFRLAPGGAQERLNVNADLITYGKIIGGGLPVGAFGGRQAIMEKIAPLGNVYQAGTLSGNPIGMIAGYTLLKELHENPSIYTSLEDKTLYLENGFRNMFGKYGIPHRINRIGSMISLHFSDHDIIDFQTAAKADILLFNRFFHFMLDRGIYLPPSAYESWFLSNALTYADLDETLQVAEGFLKDVRG